MVGRHGVKVFYCYDVDSRGYKGIMQNTSYDSVHSLVRPPTSYILNIRSVCPDKDKYLKKCIPMVIDSCFADTVRVYRWKKTVSLSRLLFTNLLKAIKRVFPFGGLWTDSVNPLIDSQLISINISFTTDTHEPLSVHLRIPTYLRPLRNSTLFQDSFVLLPTLNDCATNTIRNLIRI